MRSNKARKRMRNRANVVILNEGLPVLDKKTARQIVDQFSIFEKSYSKPARVRKDYESWQRICVKAINILEEIKKVGSPLVVE